MRNRTGPLLLLLVVLGFAACGERNVPTGTVSDNLPFDLTIPENTPVGDFNATSGIRIVDQLVLDPDDSQEVEVQSPAYYAQLVVNNGEGAVPEQVLLNGNPLKSHQGTSTLRLGSASNTNLGAENRWTFIRQGDTTVLVAEALTQIDSVAPFSSEINDGNIVRGDSSITLRWNPPLSASSGVRIIWTSHTSNYTYVKDVIDVGFFTVPATELQKLAGDGTFQLIRYRSVPHTYMEKTVILTRLAEREYDVQVVP